MLSTTPRKIATLLGAAAIAFSLCASTALASASAIYQACRDESSLDGFSKSDLQAALGGVPADLDEYNGCSARINQAIVNKSVKNIPGSGKGVKGTRAKLRKASVEDLTTPSDRKKALAMVEKETKVDDSDPLSSTTDPSIQTAAGNTLASSTAPSTPIALIIGLAGLVLLLMIDLAGRLGVIPRKKKTLPGSSERDGD